MPPFRFCAPSAYDYPASRDTKGVPLGTVQPGDVRDLDEAIDRWWAPSDGDEDRGQGYESQDSSEEGGAEDGEDAAPEPSGPQPAPPAVIANP